MLFDQLKKDNMQAMKDHDAVKRGVLGILITKCQLLITEKRAINEDLVDADVLQIIQKLIKEVSEEAEAFKTAGREEKVIELNTQVNILKAYLPAMMSEEEIKAEIAKLDDKSMPNVMKHFKANFAGKVDMSLVSKIARG